MRGAYLGPKYGSGEIERTIRKYDAKYEHFDDFGQLCQSVADLLVEGKVVGWFQGRMEYGPRALGNRSILGDARNPEMQKKMNLKIKYREGFRPFAPSILEEEISNVFQIDTVSPYMLLVAPVQESRCSPLPEDFGNLPLYERLYHPRTDLPAITHVDFSARIQSVSSETNPRYWKLISTFRKLTGCPVVVNTSFNVRGEPIVCTPDDAFRCFMRTEMDCLVMGDYLFRKKDQAALINDIDWKERFELD